MTAFLAGLRVVDLSQYVPGPYASLILRDLGADVVKVEPPAGDMTRAASWNVASMVSAASGAAFSMHAA